jgi:hypothetical protein
MKTPPRNVWPVFGDVELLATKHPIDSGAQTGLLDELDQQSERLVVDTILRIVQEHAGRLGGHPLAARRIFGEQVSQVFLCE